MMETYEKRINNLAIDIDAYKKENLSLKNNQKKDRFPNGGSVYVIKPYSLSDDNLLKIGKTDKPLNKRINTYNTSLPNNVIILYRAAVHNPTKIELCTKSKLYDFRYRNNKEYYEYPVKKIIDIIKECIVFTNDSIIEEEYYNDDDNILLDKDSNSDSNNDNSSVNDISKRSTSSSDKIRYGIYEIISTNDGEQNGGKLYSTYRDKYLKYKKKYLILKFSKM